MGRPVVTTESCAAAIDACPGRDLLVAPDAGAFVSSIDALLRDAARASAIGDAARQAILATYSWPAQLTVIDSVLDEVAALPASLAMAAA